MEQFSTESLSFIYSEEQRKIRARLVSDFIHLTKTEIPEMIACLLKLKSLDEENNYISSCLLLMQMSKEKNSRMFWSYKELSGYDLRNVWLSSVNSAERVPYVNRGWSASSKYWDTETFCWNIGYCVNALRSYNNNKLYWCSTSVLVEVICTYIYENTELEIIDLTSEIHLENISQRVEKYYKAISYEDVSNALYEGINEIFLELVWDYEMKQEEFNYFFHLSEKEMTDMITNALMLYYQEGNDYTICKTRDFARFMKILHKDTRNLTSTTKRTDSEQIHKKRRL